jgi:hypothetical protein
VFSVSALLLTDPSTIRPIVEDKRGNVPSVRTYVLPSVSEAVTSYVRIDCYDTGEQTSSPYSYRVREEELSVGTLAN